MSAKPQRRDTADALVENETVLASRTKPSTISEAMALAGVGSVSYGICAYLACVNRDKELSAAFTAQTDPLSYYWPLSAFVTALMMNILTLLFERGNVKRQLALLACYINLLAASSDLINVNGWAYLGVDSLGFTFNLSRQIMWLHTTPLMVYLISIFSDVPPKKVALVMLADAGLVLCAMSAQTTSSVVLTVLLICMALSLFSYVMREMWKMFDSALAAVADGNSKRPIESVRVFTVGLWFIFPAAWMVVHTGILTPFMEEWMWGVGDVIGKVAFSSSLVLSNFLTMDQRRLIVMHTVEQTNRLHVISELKNLVEQKERFLSSMTHELRTPLNGIIGLSDAMLVGSCGKLNDTATRTLTTIKNSGLRLLNLINDILDAAAMHKGNLVIKQEKVDLRTLVDDVLELCQPLARKRVQLVNNVPNSLPHVLGDTGRSIQIFYNLIGNSCKFTHQGYIAVTACQQGDMVEVKVSDTGIGIPEKNLKSVFNEFEQVDMSTTRKYGGTGLGLNLVQQLVKAHNGTIALTSELEKGTICTFTLPKYTEQAGAAADAPGPAQPEESALPASQPIPPAPPAAEPAEPATSPSRRVSRSGRGPNAPHRTATITLADERGAEMTASSTPPGMEKHVRKALATVASAGAAAVAKLPSKPFYWSKHGKIMVLSVDDDPTNQMVIENLLTPAGYVVRQAMDGEEALSFLQDEPCLPDIVLLDVRMPGMSGYDVCKSLRRMFPDCFIPVIMVSAQTSEEEIVEGLLSGSNDYVTKPFGRQALLARIKSHLQVKHWVYHTPKDAAGQQLADAGDAVAPAQQQAPTSTPELARLPSESKRRLLTPPSILASSCRPSLPNSMVTKLQGQGSEELLERMQHATVLVWSFKDAKDFGQNTNTDDFLAVLSGVAMQYDTLLQQHGMYSTECTAGTWVVIADTTDGAKGASDGVSRTAAFAKGLLQIAADAKLPEGKSLTVSCGIHTGPVSSMVFGLACPQLQFSGPAVYTAALLQSAAPAGCVHVSAQTASLLGDATTYLPATSTSVLLKAGQWEAAALQLPETLGGFTTDVQNLRGSVMKLSANAATPLQQALQLLTQSWPQSLWDSATLVEAPADVRQLQAHCTALEQQLQEVTEEAGRLQESMEKLESQGAQQGSGIDGPDPLLLKRMDALETELGMTRQERNHLQSKLEDALMQLSHTQAQLQYARSIQAAEPSRCSGQLLSGSISLEERIAVLKQAQQAYRVSPSTSPRASDRITAAMPYSISSSPSRRSSYAFSDVEFSGPLSPPVVRRKPTLAGILEEAGLLQHLEAFETQDITPELLPHLQDEDLIGMGVTKVGARVRFKAICKQLANLPEISE